MSEPRLAGVDPQEAPVLRSAKVFIISSIDFGAVPSSFESDTGTAAESGLLRDAALAAFIEFAAIVADCQSAGSLPQSATSELAGLLFASVHGLIDLDAGGRLRRKKGLRGVTSGVDLLLRVLSIGKTS